VRGRDIGIERDRAVDLVNCRRVLAALRKNCPRETQAVEMSRLRRENAPIALLGLGQLTGLVQGQRCAQNPRYIDGVARCWRGVLPVRCGLLLLA
jgi:hypothetical protein